MRENSGSLKQIAWPWRVLFEKERRGYLWRLFRKDYGGGELAYLSLGLRGLQLEIEFPTEWHEERRGWIRVGFILGVLAVSFPWSKISPDHGQCSGPQYGFHFYEDLLWIHYGQSTGRSVDPKRTLSLYMPWHWRHQWHAIDTKPSDHPYHYELKDGTVQERVATIQIERRRWMRYWLPFRRTSQYIDVRFSDEVGERTGSWKGGTIGCSYEMNALEKAMPEFGALECLRRMERERSF